MVYSMLHTDSSRFFLFSCVGSIETTHCPRMEEFTRLHYDFLFYSDQRSLNGFCIFLFCDLEQRFCQNYANVFSMFCSSFFESLVSRVMQKLNWSSFVRLFLFSLLTKCYFSTKKKKLKTCTTFTHEYRVAFKNSEITLNLFLVSFFRLIFRFFSLQKTPKCIRFVRAFGFFCPLTRFLLIFSVSDVLFSGSFLVSHPKANEETKYKSTTE